MRIPVDWLNDYVPNDLSMRDLAYILTNVGLEVEEIAEGSATTVFDIKVTPNRGDCLSVLGVARELGMALRKPVRDRKPSITEPGAETGSLVKITLDDPALCPRYSARLVRGVKIGPSPEWAQQRLELCGLRPINNVVDATNLAMLELGQPLHAFDYQLLAHTEGDVPEIIVRRAKSGEHLLTIDGEERALTPDLLLITDASGPIAVAGVMGGGSTEINDGTTEVLLESAHFDPSVIRKGARALGMSTAASYRFERTVDPGGTIRALDRACELMLEFCDGGVEIAKGVADAYPQPYEPAVISLRPARANELLGLELTVSEIEEHLQRLDLAIEEGETLAVRAPTFRQDLKEEIDLVEEVARVHGYENIPEALPQAASEVAGLPPELAFERQVRHLMRGLGLSESVTSSLEGAAGADLLGLPAEDPRRRVVVLSNWKTIDRSQLRTTLITSLMEVVSHNARHDIDDVAIFDVGCAYLEEGGDMLPKQPQHLGLAVTGRMTGGAWHISEEIRNWDFYGLKGVVENLLTAMGHQHAEFVPDAPPPWRPGHAARVEIEGRPVGHFGEVRREVRDEYDLAYPLYTAEFDLDALRELAIEDVQYRQVSRYPAVRRDVAFLLPREMDSKRAETVIGEAAGAELESLMLFDAFEGKPLPAGKRNLAFSLSFRSADQTLTDEEVEAAMARVRDALRTELGAEIRE